MTKMWMRFQNLGLKACAGRLRAAWRFGLRSLLLAPCLLLAEEGRVLKQVKDSAERGRLSDARQIVRGDTGKWSDVAELRPAPPLARKPAGLALDAWLEELTGRAVELTGRAVELTGRAVELTGRAVELTGRAVELVAGDEVWLLYRSRQLDDNDRLWIERIERSGNAFTVTLHEAIWQGDYFKTFTYHEVGAVNLGRLAAGEYTVTWRVLPLQFRQLEKPREAQRDYVSNWPVDAQMAAGQAVVLKTRLRVPE